MPAPSTPGSFAAQALGADEILLTWSAPDSGDQGGYQCRRRVAGGSWVNLDLITADRLKYDDIGLQDGTNYEYELQAYNIYGSSAWTPTTAASTPLAAPGPLSVSTFPGMHAANLSWATHTARATGQEVWRSAGGAAYSLLTTLPANAVVCSDSGLTQGMSYAYKVRAVRYNSGTQATDYSDWSNAVGVTSP
jgi:hypothetical protein